MLKHVPHVCCTLTTVCMSAHLCLLLLLQSCCFDLSLTVLCVCFFLSPVQKRKKETPLNTRDKRDTSCQRFTRNFFKLIAWANGGCRTTSSLLVDYLHYFHYGLNRTSSLEWKAEPDWSLSEMMWNTLQPPKIPRLKGEEVANHAFPLQIPTLFRGNAAALTSALTIRSCFKHVTLHTASSSHSIPRHTAEFRRWGVEEEWRYLCFVSVKFCVSRAESEPPDHLGFWGGET